MALTLKRPSYHQGFADRPSRSAYPIFWKGLHGAWAPGLGVTGLNPLRDYGFGNNEGTFEGSMTMADWVIGGRRGSGYSLFLRGTDDDIDITSNAILPIPWTIIVWMKTSDTADTFRTIISFGNTNDNTDHIFIGLRRFTANGPYARFHISESGNALTAVGTTTDVQDGNWHQLVGVARAVDDGDLYIDGKLEVAATGSAIVDPFAKLNLGKIGNLTRASELQFYTGQFDDVRIYNRALTPAEIALDYQIALPPLILRPQLFVKAPAAVAVTVPDQTLAPTSQMTNSGGMVGNVIMKRRDRIYVPEQLHG